MQKVCPALRITDYEKSKSFYVDGLGFQIDGEHRFAPHLPVFMTISRDGMSLYLSQHAGDCQPGGLVFLYVEDVDAWYAEITSRGIEAESPPENFILMTGAATLGVVAPGCATSKGEKKMYGLIGKMTAVSGQRDALIAILIKGVNDMPGCLSYIVAKDPADANTIWITEVWDSKVSHDASLSLPSVKQAIARGKPLIAGFGESVVTEPVGGHGLAMAKVR